MDNGSTVAGLNLLGPAFVDVGLTSTKLDALKVTNTSAGEVTSGSCGITLIDENGNTIKTYTWKSAGRGTAKTWAWYDGSTKVDASVVFARGAGVLFTAEANGDVLKSAGEVNLDAISYSETLAGLNVIANPFPLSLSMSVLSVANASDGEVTSGSCGITLIDENGNTVKTYTWKSAGRGTAKTWGWYDGSTKIDDTVMLAPGQAVLFTAETAGDKLIFPAQK